MKLTPQILREAYQLGVFPMAKARDSGELVWVRPQARGIFPLDHFHVPRSLKKVLRQDRFEVVVNRDFQRVMRLCASPSAGREETWINADIVRAYSQLHRMGHAHSVECYREGELVGGLYGVAIKAAFFGESMFSLETDASKVALCHLVGRLRMADYRLLDTQFLTDHLARFGGVEVPAERYEEMLSDALRHSGHFAALPDQIPGSSILQSITQTS